MAKTFVFILAGGSGTRLAPLSLTGPGKLPKQFLALVGKTTMLQQTAGCDEFSLTEANYFTIRHLRPITVDTAMNFMQQTP